MPVTFHDFLAKGAAESKMVPGQGIDLLNEAVRIRPGSPVARLIRAQAGWRQALHTFDLQDVERALNDAVARHAPVPFATPRGQFDLVTRYPQGQQVASALQGNCSGELLTLWAEDRAMLAEHPGTDAEGHPQEDDLWPRAQRAC